MHRPAAFTQRANFRRQRNPLLTTFTRRRLWCNDTRFTSREGQWCAEGDPMEGALLALAGKISGQGGQAFGGHTRLDAVPFDAAHRYMAVLSLDSDRPAAEFM